MNKQKRAAAVYKVQYFFLLWYQFDGENAPRRILGTRRDPPQFTGRVQVDLSAATLFVLCSKSGRVYRTHPGGQNREAITT